MYAVLLTGRPTALHLPVAAYVLAIAAMAAQAIGRAGAAGAAGAQGSPAARRVAWGAVAFMCSDALLGINRFVMPLPLSPVWVLGTYYLAQALIIVNVLTPPPADAQPPNKSALLPGGTSPR